MMRPQVFMLTYNSTQTPADAEVTFKLVSPEDLFNYRLWDAQHNVLHPDQRPVFYSFAEPFDAIDFPTNDQALTILSERAIAVLGEVSNRHGCQISKLTVINTVMDELNDPREGLTDVQDIIQQSLQFPGHFSENFYALRPPVMSGLFDHERSKYESYSNGNIGIVDQYIFHDYEGTLPPLFTLDEQPGIVFITQELRDQWKLKGITGTAYNQLEKPWQTPTVDVELSQSV